LNGTLQSEKNGEVITKSQSFQGGGGLLTTGERRGRRGTPEKGSRGKKRPRNNPEAEGRGAETLNMLTSITGKGPCASVQRTVKERTKTVGNRLQKGKGGVLREKEKGPAPRIALAVASEVASFFGCCQERVDAHHSHRAQSMRKKKRRRRKRKEKEGRGQT